MKEDCICVPIGWPDTWSKGGDKILKLLYKLNISKDQYYKVGHAAMLIIHKETGYVEYFDFGRYTTHPDNGRVRSEETDPGLHIPIQAELEGEKIKNLIEIVDYLFTISHITHGYGMIYFSLYPYMNYEKVKAFTDDLISKGSVRYTTFGPASTNCARFILGALLAGGTRRYDKIKGVLCPTFRASPVGTAVDFGYESDVFRKKDSESELENFPMSRWDNFKLLWDSVKVNLKGEKKTIERNNHLNPEPLHEDLDPSVQWLGGLGEGYWLRIRTLQNKLYRITAYYPDSVINYDTVVVDESGTFDIDENYKFVWDCSRMFITIEQNNTKYKMDLVEDFVEWEKKHLQEVKTEKIS